MCQLRTVRENIVLVSGNLRQDTTIRCRRHRDGELAIGPGPDSHRRRDGDKATYRGILSKLPLTSTMFSRTVRKARHIAEKWPFFHQPGAIGIAPAARQPTHLRCSGARFMANMCSCCSYPSPPLCCSSQGARLGVFRQWRRLTNRARANLAHHSHLESPRRNPLALDPEPGPRVLLGPYGLGGRIPLEEFLFPSSLAPSR